MARGEERDDGAPGGLLAALAAAALLALALSTALHRAAAVADGYRCVRLRTASDALALRLAAAETALTQTFAALAGAPVAGHATPPEPETH